MAADGIISREKLIDVLKGISQLPYLDSTAGTGLSGDAFRWIFRVLFAPNIMSVLSSKDYGAEPTLELVRDLDLYFEGEPVLNDSTMSRLKVIIRDMFGTSDLSRIYRLLNTGTL